MGAGMAAGEDAELRGLELEHHGAGDPPGPARGLPGLVGQPPDRRLQRLQRQVLGEGVLAGDRLHRLVRLHRALVDAACAPVQRGAEAAELLPQLFQWPRTQVADGGDAQRRQLALRHLAHAGDAADRQRGQEGFDLVRADHAQAVRLVPVRGDLGQELVRRHPGRGGQRGDLADLRPNRLGHRGGAGQAGLRRGHVQVGLVQRQRFDQVGMFEHDLAHLARDGLVAAEVRRHEHRLRTQALGAQGRHRRAHAELARLVGGRADHRAGAAPGHHHRAAAQRRVVALLHRRVERVHVHMDDLARGGRAGRIHRTHCAATAARTPAYVQTFD